MWSRISRNIFNFCGTPKLCLSNQPQKKDVCVLSVKKNKSRSCATSRPSIWHHPRATLLLTSRKTTKSISLISEWRSAKKKEKRKREEDEEGFLETQREKGQKSKMKRKAADEDGFLKTQRKEWQKSMTKRKAADEEGFLETQRKKGQKSKMRRRATNIAEKSEALRMLLWGNSSMRLFTGPTLCVSVVQLAQLPAQCGDLWWKGKSWDSEECQRSSWARIQLWAQAGMTISSFHWL